MTQDTAPLARSLLQVCEARRLQVATAESCTGGLIAAALTEIPGSSTVFERGFVTYSNAAKSASLGVPASEPTDRPAREQHGWRGGGAAWQPIDYC